MIKRLSLYRPAIESTAHYRVLGGGAGSGKSVAVVQDIVNLAASEGKRILVIRKTARTLRHSTHQLIVDLIAALGRSHMVQVNKQEMRFTFPSGGSIIQVGLDDPEKIKSIAEIDEVWIEEATEITKQEFQLVDIRLRGEGRKRITITFNPTVKAKWIRKYLVERTDEDSPDASEVYVQFTTALDNPFAGADYYERLKTLPPELRDVYAYGKWGEALEGLIFPAYELTDAPCEPDYYGLDFGFNNPSALVGVQDLDPIMRVEELLYQRGLTNTDLADRLEEIVTDKSKIIYCDAAEPARIEELARRGFNTRPANKSVKDGIDTVRRYTIQATRHSQNLINEVQEYVWDADRRTGELSDEKPVKHNDHTMDAMRYAIHTEQAEAHNTWGLWGA